MSVATRNTPNRMWFFSSWCEGPFEGLFWGGTCSSPQGSLQLGVEGTRGHVQGSTLGLFSSSFTSMGPRKAVYPDFNVLSAQFSSVSPQLLSPEFSLSRGSQSRRSTFWGSLLAAFLPAVLSTSLAGRHQFLTYSLPPTFPSSLKQRFGMEEGG